MATFLYDRVVYKPTQANATYTPPAQAYTHSAIPRKTDTAPARTNALPEVAMARDLENRVRTLNSALNKQLALMAR